MLRIFRFSSILLSPRNKSLLFVTLYFLLKINPYFPFHQKNPLVGTRLVVRVNTAGRKSVFLFRSICIHHHLSVIHWNYDGFDGDEDGNGAIEINSILELSQANAEIAETGTKFQSILSTDAFSAHNSPLLTSVCLYGCVCGWSAWILGWT